jgi:hypothetical protein
MPADFLTIATQGLVKARYRGSQILPCVYPAQRGIGAGFYCLNWLSNCHAATFSNFGESSFRKQPESEDVVFFESALHLKRGPHMVVECVPIPDEMGDMAPMYFQKAIQECEGEWTHNKKLIALSRERRLRRSVPKGLPYFHVGFGMDEGFAHVVEDEVDFPDNFAQGKNRETQCYCIV